MKNCAVLLGTNALIEYGLRVAYSDGSPIQPICENQTSEYNVLNVMLTQGVHLKPGHTKWVSATIDTSDDVVQPGKNRYRMVVPNEEVLVTNQCDFQEGLWNGNSDIIVLLTNWGKEPIFINKHAPIGKTEQVDLVSKDNPH